MFLNDSASLLIISCLPNAVLVQRDDLSQFDKIGVIENWTFIAREIELLVSFSVDEALLFKKRKSHI